MSLGNLMLVGVGLCLVFGQWCASAAEPDSIPLWPGEPPASAAGDSFLPYLQPFLVDTDAPRGAVLVCPGGGYSGRAEHEGAPIAQRFNEAGFHAFVVQYRVAPNRHPAPIMDAARALRIIRSRADEWRVLPDHIAILGFSAGGHLAASLAVHFATDDVKGGDDLDAVSARPDAAILCYPVISTGKFGHRGSCQNLLGPEPSEAMIAYVSLETQVTDQTPPTFLWHTASDEGVPVENSLLFAEALSAHKVPFELHVYPNGRHGLGLSPEDAHVATWSALCCEWLAGMGW